ncbi:UbiA family prenyltransferase [Aestuariivirga sp.]|uniref:UbiA family prenyltransferase n=1 Tax=Aestuariivirga sp. TaxID=2650926 RepID=UPI003BAA9281
MESARASLSVTRAVPIVVAMESASFSSPVYEWLIIALFWHPQKLLRVLPRVLSVSSGSLASLLPTNFDFTNHPLPLRQDLLQWLTERAAAGHAIHLCSPAAGGVLDQLSQRIGACGSVAPLADVPPGSARASYLQRHFPDGFIYVGDERTDSAVWRAADGIVLTGHAHTGEHQPKGQDRPVLAAFPNPQLTLSDILKAVRVHHWSKNLLLFFPLILSHQWHNVHLIFQTIAAFLCLLAVTSATYLLNDLADLKADRLHWAKRHRPLASGRMTACFGVFLAFALLAAGVSGALLISTSFAAVLLTYLLLTLAYSVRLKSIPLLDTLIIGLLFTLRLVMGCTLIENPRPAWLLTFSVFFFFSLAVAKRHTEVLRAAGSVTAVLQSRGYQPEDSPLTLALGVSAALASLVVFFIFILLEMLPAKIYERPEFLFAIPIALAIWMGRVWLLAHRGEMKDDPVSFALRDSCSLVLGAVVATAFILAL